MIDHAAMSDAAKREELLDEIIYRAVRGEETPWLLDPEFKARGTFEDRFRDGDKQILLWEIDDCAQSGRPIPKWAAEALHGLLYGAVKGQAKSWDDASSEDFTQRVHKVLAACPDCRLWSMFGFGFANLEPRGPCD